MTTISDRFVVVRDKGGLGERFISFDKEASRLVIGEVSKGPSVPDQFVVELSWNESEERRDVTVTCGLETGTFSADELWRVSRRALSWMLF